MFASAGLSSNAAAPTGVSVAAAADVLGALVWCDRDRDDDHHRDDRDGP